MRNFTRSKFLMTRLSAEKEQAIRYFLGELSETEQGAVEERFFVDEDYSRFLDAAENDFINDYVGGKLDLRQMRNFECRFLVSERRCANVRSAQILQAAGLVEQEKDVIFAAPKIFLRQRLEELFSIPRSIRAGGFAAIAILISLGVFWLVYLPENNQTARIENENQRPIIEVTKQSSSTNESPPKLNKTQKVGQNPIAENEKPKISPKPKSNPAFTLLPPMQAAEKSVIAESHDAKNYRFRVVHNNTQQFASYRVEIHASDGDLIWSREIVADEKTLQKPLALAVRRGALSSGSYELMMSGATDDGQLEEINSYNFSVQKK